MLSFDISFISKDATVRQFYFAAVTMDFLVMAVYIYRKKATYRDMRPHSPILAM